MGREKYPAFNKVNFTMSGIQSKMFNYAKKQGNITHNENK